MIVDEVSHGVGVFGIDVREFGAAREPPTPLPVLILYLPTLPRAVGLAEPDAEVVDGFEGGLSGPLGTLVERERRTQVRRYLLESFDQSAERGQ